MLRRVGPWLFFALGAVGLLVALAAWQRNGYWEYSDGVYAASARELLHGRDLYGQMAGAQPPLVYLAGALLLAIHDGLASIRAGMALFDLATASLVVAVVWRLTGRAWLAAGSGLVALLLPWTLHEHAQLTPETLGAPLVLGSALLAARAPRAVTAGALGALAVACKLAFALPVLLIALSAARRRRALGSLAACAAVLALAGTAVFGTGLWRESVVAQLEVGSHALHYVGGLWAQAAWNLAPFAVPAVAAVLLRERAREPRLVVTTAAAAIGSLLLVATVYKNGTYLNVVQLAEAPLLSLAAAGAVWLLDIRATPALAAGGCLALLGVAQVASLLAAPDNPRPFARPFAASSPGRASSPAGVRRATDAARACPPGVAYSGPPYIAFLARRRMPGHQPDQFIIANARQDARFAKLAAADQPRCP
jgi:hypothetical protein